MIGYYNYTVILTYASLASAVVGVVNAFSGNIKAAIICLMICGICDMFDGSIARLKKRTDEEVSFGAHIDSLTDLVAFGVLPATILYGLGLKSVLGIVIMVLYVLAALIRLAYFDVQEMFEINKNKDFKRTHFTGLPVTNASIILPSVMAIFSFFDVNFIWVYGITLVATGIAFVTPFKMKKLYLPWLLIPAVVGIGVAVVIFMYGGNFGV